MQGEGKKDNKDKDATAHYIFKYISICRDCSPDREVTIPAWIKKKARKTGMNFGKVCRFELQRK